MSLGKDGQLKGKPAVGTGGRSYSFSVCAIDLTGSQVCVLVTLYVKPLPPATLVITSAKYVPNYGEPYWNVTGTASGPVGAVLEGSMSATAQCGGWHMPLFGDCVRNSGDPETITFTIGGLIPEPGLALDISLDGVVLVSAPVP